MSLQRTQTLHLTLDNTQLIQVHTHRHLGLVPQDLRLEQPYSQLNLQRAKNAIPTYR